MFKKELIKNIDKIHITDMGLKRISDNLSLNEKDVLCVCKEMIKDDESSIRKEGKNYYVYKDNIVLTINSSSYTIITARLRKDIEYIVESADLYLRKMTRKDRKVLSSIISDKETMKYYPKPYDENGVERWLNWTFDNYRKYGFGLWSLCLKRNDKMIGDMGITMQFIDGEYRPEVGYHINKKYWRKGYAKQMGVKVVEWGFTNTEFETLYSYCNKENTASYKTAEAIGMHFYKEYESEKETEHVSYITKEEWEKTRDN